MQPSSSTRATIVSAESQNGATIVMATFFLCRYYIVWESNDAGNARGQYWNESLKSRWIPVRIVRLYEWCKAKTFRCAFFAAAMLTMVGSPQCCSCQRLYPACVVKYVFPHCWWFVRIANVGSVNSCSLDQCSRYAANDDFKKLTYWGWVTHIYVSKLTIIGSDNGLSPGRRWAIIWTCAGILFIGNLRTNFSEILMEIHTFSLKKMHLLGWR